MLLGPSTLPLFALLPLTVSILALLADVPGSDTAACACLGAAAAGADVGPLFIFSNAQWPVIFIKKKERKKCKYRHQSKEKTPKRMKEKERKQTKLCRRRDGKGVRDSGGRACSGRPRRARAQALPHKLASTRELTTGEVSLKMQSFRSFQTRHTERERRERTALFLPPDLLAAEASQGPRSSLGRGKHWVWPAFKRIEWITVRVKQSFIRSEMVSAS